KGALSPRTVTLAAPAKSVSSVVTAPLVMRSSRRASTMTWRSSIRSSSSKALTISVMMDRLADSGGITMMVVCSSVMNCDMGGLLAGLSRWSGARQTLEDQVIAAPLGQRCAVVMPPSVGGYGDASGLDPGHQQVTLDGQDEILEQLLNGLVRVVAQTDG